MKDEIFNHEEHAERNHKGREERKGCLIQSLQLSADCSMFSVLFHPSSFILTIKGVLYAIVA